MLGLFCYPQSTKIILNQTVKIQIWLSTLPHRIYGNDTVRIQWRSTQCTNCFKWIPEELNFNDENFQEKQILAITRVKYVPPTTLISIFNGGGFDVVPLEIYLIFTQITFQNSYCCSVISRKNKNM
ncbi:unnamed protein product [Rotaria sp. Silwood2]|nr:unnamed protein product [Rotaria sp. Silwood2]CAF3472294.1 unnamed protein product [Rotaria sp. Silwood2]CAF4642858.1 unnamed protein product [Rotaria sp. Silwood2]